MTDKRLFIAVCVMTLVLIAIGARELLTRRTRTPVRVSEGGPFRTGMTSVASDAEVRGARRRRAWMLGVLALMLTTPLTPAWLGVDAYLPVRWHTGSHPSMDHDPPFGDFGHVVEIVAAGVFLLARFVPMAITAFVAMLASRSSRTTVLASGRRTLLATVVVASAVLLVMGARMAMGGAPPSAFDVFGALTPRGAHAGWALSDAIGRYVAPGTPRHRVERGAPLPGFLTTIHIPQSDCCGGFASMGEDRVRPVEGLACSVGGEAGVIQLDPTAQRWIFHPVVDAVTDASPARPFFRELPWSVSGAPPETTWATRGVLIEGERADDGAPLVVVGTQTAWSAVRIHDVAFLVRPRWEPFVLLACALGVVAWRARRERQGVADAPWIRLVMAWLLWEATVAAAILFSPYF